MSHGIISWGVAVQHIMEDAMLFIRQARSPTSKVSWRGRIGALCHWGGGMGVGRVVCVKWDVTITERGRDL